MNPRRIATIALALLVGLGGPALLAEMATRPAPPTAEAAAELPWPYCGPDAPAPSFAPIPERVPEELTEAGIAVDPGFFGPIRPLLAGDALVPITRLEIVKRVDLATRHPEIWARYVGLLGPRLAGFLNPPRLLAEVDTGPAVFQMDASVKRLGVLEGGPRRIVGDVALIRTLAEHLAAGHQVLAAVSGMWDDGTLGVDFGLDLTTGEVLWSDGFIPEDRTYFAEFVRTYFPEASSGPALAELVIAWNREQEAPEGERPIDEAWGRFIAETFGLGYRELHGIPEPGTREWWEQAPPLCRSLADAPPEVLAALDPVRVIVHVPPEMPEPEDAAICLRLPLGTMPYCSVFRPNPELHYLEFEAYTDGVNPISVQIAHDTPRGLSWVERVEVAKIPPELARSGTVLVRLDPALAGRTYAEIAAKAEATASRVGPLGDVDPFEGSGG